jgi:VanZ like protein
MNVRALAARYAQIRPKKAHVALPLFIMALLYWLSSLPGTPLPEDPATYALFYWVSPSVQNILHIPAYAALSCAWNWALYAWLRVPIARVLGACVLASTYGGFDEWHQSFVPGRYASLTDVALDITGAAVGIWAFHWALQQARGKAT